MQADGWTDLQEQLLAHGYSGSEFFTIGFLFIGHFIFTNLFIGVVIMVSSLL
jgi:cation channel sperm-associated protein 3